MISFHAFAGRRGQTSEKPVGADDYPTASRKLADQARARRPNGLQIRIGIVNMGSKIRIISEVLHDRNSPSLAIANDAPESFDIGQCIDQRRSEARTNAIPPMAVIAP
jgi:hypothetical protein